MNCGGRVGCSLYHINFFPQCRSDFGDTLVKLVNLLRMVVLYLRDTVEELGDL